jgi:hypothetical protein
MSSRIYIITQRADASVVRYVRANTLAQAIRALADETFLASPASTEDLYRAMKAGQFEVLDAAGDESTPIGDAPPEAERRGPKRAPAPERTSTPPTLVPAA